MSLGYIYVYICVYGYNIILYIIYIFLDLYIYKYINFIHYLYIFRSAWRFTSFSSSYSLSLLSLSSVVLNSDKISCNSFLPSQWPYPRIEVLSLILNITPESEADECLLTSGWQVSANQWLTSGDDGNSGERIIRWRVTADEWRLTSDRWRVTASVMWL